MQTVGFQVNLICLMLFLSACSVRNPPKLPDFRQKTFSSEEILQKKKELEEKVKKIRESSELSANGAIGGI